MAERSKAAVLKTVERKFRRFESFPLRHMSATLLVKHDNKKAKTFRNPHLAGFFVILPSCERDNCDKKNDITRHKNYDQNYDRDMTLTMTNYDQL